MPELIAGRDWLFGDDYYCIDVSHLSSVVQMSMNLPVCPELEMVRELCLYGGKLSQCFQYPAPPPFEDQYQDYGIYFAILAGENVEAGLAHFRTKVEQSYQPPTAESAESAEEMADAAAAMGMEMEGGGGDTYPAEVLVNLLLRLDRPKEALLIARKYLGGGMNGAFAVRALWSCASASTIMAPWPRWRTSRTIRCILSRDCSRRRRNKSAACGLALSAACGLRFCRLRLTPLPR